VKVAKVLPKNPTLEVQVKLLTREVLIMHEDFDKGTVGIIVSLIQKYEMYWVLLNHMYKTKDGRWSRKKLFKETELRLIDNK